MRFIILPGFTMDKNHKDINYLVNKFKSKFPNSTYHIVNPPLRKITIYKNKKYRAWYDYYSNYITKEECINVNHLIESRNKLHTLLDSYKSKKDIYLVGYSQGCCMALDAGLTYHKKIGGIIGIKGHIPIQTFTKLNTKQRLWVTHGKKDKSIGFNVASNSYKKINNKTFLVQNTNHSIKHGINEQLNSIYKFVLN